MTLLTDRSIAPLSKYGYLGVELFFMISGFVILMSAARGSLREFVVSRVVRLYPAFWACCTLTFIVTCAIGGPRFSASISQYLINMTMLSGFFGVPSIDGVYWSLFVEMQFYALVCIVLIVGRIHNAELLLIVWLIASVVLEIVPIGELRFILIVDYAAYFIAGATFFLIWSQGTTATRIGMIVLSWSLAVCQSLKHQVGFERYYDTVMNSYLISGIITSFFVVMLLVSLKQTRIIGRQRWFLAGALTYPLYLLHQRIGYMIFNAAYPAVSPHILLWSTVLAVLGTAFAIHILVEKKFSRLMKKALNNCIDFLQRTGKCTPKLDP